WTQSGNTAYCSVTTSPSYVHSGAYGAELGPTGSFAYLAQSVPTLPGQAYVLSYWLEDVKGGTPNEFIASWNGTTLIDAVNTAAHPWAQSQFIVMGVDGNSSLQFAFRNDPAYFGFDDVSLTPILPPQFQAATPSAGALQF